jgi:hypothetical protein
LFYAGRGFSPLKIEWHTHLLLGIAHVCKKEHWQQDQDASQESHASNFPITAPSVNHLEKK